jgi:hypothetical protein
MAVVPALAFDECNAQPKKNVSLRARIEMEGFKLWRRDGEIRDCPSVAVAPPKISSKLANRCHTPLKVQRNCQAKKKGCKAGFVGASFFSVHFHSILMVCAR